MELQIGYGQKPQTLTVPDENLAGVLYANHLEKSTKSGPELVKEALLNPVGPRLSQIVRPGEKTVIVTSDVTRPVPSYKIIPAILDELFSAGLSAADITVVFALGSHRRQTDEERRKLVGPVYDLVTCVDGDPDDCIHMGVTKMGTPVDITRIVAEAKRRITVANIEYHYFAGYSGGAKTIMPGVSTRAAIQSNHSRMIDPLARAGLLEGNPVREDLEEAINFCPIDFIVNVVLDEHKEIVMATAGHHVEAHRLGCRFLDSLYQVEIANKADIVIASQGGAPKDLNLYQTQKALDNAAHAVKNGGIIILVGACQEGLGERVFEEWMTKAKDPPSLIRRIEMDFQLGGHKAAAIAMVLEKAEIYLVSEMEPDFVRSIFLNPFNSVTAALTVAFEKLGPKSKVLIMPFAGSVLPVVKS